MPCHDDVPPCNGGDADTKRCYKLIVLRVDEEFLKSRCTKYIHVYFADNGKSGNRADTNNIRY